MKQPVNCISVFQSGFDNQVTAYVGITALANARNVPAALRLAIKRLDRLKRDCERELAKQEVGK